MKLRLGNKGENSTGFIKNTNKCPPTSNLYLLSRSLPGIIVGYLNVDTDRSYTKQNLSMSSE